MVSMGSLATLIDFCVFVYRMCSRNMTISRPFRGFLSGHYEKRETKKCRKSLILRHLVNFVN